MNLKKVYPSYFLILPIVLYTGLFILPSIAGIGYSLTDWNTYNEKINFIGLENFKEIFSESRNLLFIRNTLSFAGVTTFFKVLIGLILAVLLDQNLKTRNILRTIFYFPVILSPLIIGMIFKSVFQPAGILNEFLRFIGMGFITRPWLVDLQTAMPSVMAVEIWRLSGYCMVIFLAGLQTIPRSYYEAAEIDGAGWWNSFKYITLPFLRPSLTINIILNIIWGLKVFEVVFVLTKGGPGYTTGVINTAVYQLFSTGRYGMATAFGVLIFIFTTIIAFFVLRLMTNKQEEFS